MQGACSSIPPSGVAGGRILTPEEYGKEKKRQDDTRARFAMRIVRNTLLIFVGLVVFGVLTSDNAALVLLAVIFAFILGYWWKAGDYVALTVALGFAFLVIAA